MQEEHRVIHTFPKYTVSNYGRVEAIDTQLQIATSANPRGFLKVNLRRNGETHTRSVNHLVADAFLDEPDQSDFISLIHKDGDKKNCNVQNLIWRPRHFSIKYHLQFDSPRFKDLTKPVWNMSDHIRYDSAQEAAIQNGLLLVDVLRAIYANTTTWPTYQEFQFANN